MLLHNSLVSCILRLSRNSWKPGKVSSYEVDDNIECSIVGIRTNPTIWEFYSRSKFRVIFATWLTTPRRGGGSGWLVVAWIEAATAAASHTMEERVALDPAVT